MPAHGALTSSPHSADAILVSASSSPVLTPRFFLARFFLGFSDSGTLAAILSHELTPLSGPTPDFGLKAGLKAGLFTALGLAVSGLGAPWAMRDLGPEGGLGMRLVGAVVGRSDACWRR